MQTETIKDLFVKLSSSQYKVSLIEDINTNTYTVMVTTNYDGLEFTSQAQMTKLYMVAITDNKLPKQIVGKLMADINFKIQEYEKEKLTGQPQYSTASGTTPYAPTFSEKFYSNQSYYANVTSKFKTAAPENMPKSLEEMYASADWEYLTTEPMLAAQVGPKIDEMNKITLNKIAKGMNKMLAGPTWDLVKIESPLLYELKKT